MKNEEMNQCEVFETLSGIDFTDKIEKKKSDDGKTELSYVSWAYAWSEAKKRFPTLNFEVHENPANGLPIFGNAALGYYVKTSVEINGTKHTLSLPVLDSKNKPMKDEPYSYETKFSGRKTVAAIDIFAVNKAIMRCLVKTLALFGVGIYVYAGEDLPESENPKITNKPLGLKERFSIEQARDENALKVICAKLKEKGFDRAELVAAYNARAAKLADEISGTETPKQAETESGGEIKTGMPAPAPKTPENGEKAEKPSKQSDATEKPEKTEIPTQETTTAREAREFIERAREQARKKAAKMREAGTLPLGEIASTARKNVLPD